MRAGYYKEIITDCFGKDGIGTFKSKLTLGKLTKFPEMSAEEAKAYIIKKHDLKTSEHAMAVSVKIFDTPSDFDQYELDMAEFYNADPSDRDDIIVTEPEEFSFLVVNNATDTAD